MQVAHGHGQQALGDAELAHGAARARVLRTVHVVDYYGPAGAQPRPETLKRGGGGRVEVGVERDQGKAQPLAAGKALREPAPVEDGPLRVRQALRRSSYF